MYAFVANRAVLGTDTLGLRFTWDGWGAYSIQGPAPAAAETLGLTGWEYFNPVVNVRRPYSDERSTCPCGHQLALSGSCKAKVTYYTDPPDILLHEMFHVTAHFKTAHDAFAETAQTWADTCMSLDQAHCVKAVIIDEMRNACMFEAYATGWQWDCWLLADPDSPVCREAAELMGRYARARDALTRALDRCSSLQ